MRQFSKWVRVMLLLVTLLTGCLEKAPATLPTNTSLPSPTPLSTALDACVQTGSELKFESIEQSSGVMKLYSGVMPQIFVISDVYEADSLISYFSPQAQNDLRNLDYENKFALVIFQGLDKSVHGVKIQHIRQDEFYIHICVAFVDSDTSTLENVSSPYHLIALDKDNWMKGKTLNFSVYERERPILFKTHTIPYAPCPSGGDEVTFETIEKSLHNQEVYQEKSPIFFIANNVQEAEPFLPFLTTNAQKVVHSLNYEHESVLALFQGYKGSYLYGVDIHHIYQASTNITICATFTTPAGMTADMISSPYHLVKIPKLNGIDNPLFHIYANGEPIISYPRTLP